VSFYFLDSSARSAWLAATTQQAQLEGLRDEWAGQMSVRCYSAADAHLVTVTHATPIVDPTTTPRSLRLGAWVAESHVQDGTAAYAILAVPAGADILRCDVALAGAISDPGGRVRLDIGTTLRVQATSTLPEASTPTWRTAMVDTDKVYEIGAAPTGLSATVSWPAAGSSSLLMNNGGDNNPWRLHASYGGSVFVPELGAYGTMIFGSTGEATISNQLTAFPFSESSPTWAWFQQPDYPISEAEAIAADADMYYSAADYAALASGKKIDSVGEATFSSTWDKTFPVGVSNWVIRRKLTDSLTGDSRPWFFRYEMPVYIPPAMTGEAAGAIVVTSLGTIYGPFSQGPAPTGTADADWFADVWGSGRRKHYLWAMNVSTKVWTRLAAVPDFAPNSSVVMLPLACVDEDAARVYYWLISDSNNSLLYADFSSGSASMTVSSPAAMTDTSGGAAPSLAGGCVLCHITTGALAGKKLWYMKDQSSASLLLIDIGANTMRKLTITGLPSTGLFWIFSWDAANQRLILTTKSSGAGVTSYRIPIPTDYTNAAAYTVTSQALTLDTGVTLESTADSFPWQSGDRGILLPSLGTIQLTQADGKMLAYIPS